MNRLICLIQFHFQLIVCVEIVWDQENTEYEITKNKQSKGVERPLEATPAVDVGPEGWTDYHPET